MFKGIFLSLLMVITIVPKSLFANDDVTTVPWVDLNLYVGKWFEIASIPQSFQRKCVRNTTAEYSLVQNDLIKVLNSCDKEDGKRMMAEGRARIEDTTSNSKLRVTFVKLIQWVFTFGGNYWIIDLAPDYSYAVVGDPSRKYLWILARQPTLPIKTLATIERKITDQGYDSSLILTSIQNGGFDTRKPLPEVIGGNDNY